MTLGLFPRFGRRVLPSGISDGARSLLHGSAWLVISGVITQGATLLGNLIVANVLGVQSYGHYALVQITVSLLGLLAQLGFGTVISQQVSSSLRSNPDRASEIAGFCLALTLLVGVIFAGALFFGRSFLSAHVFRDTDLRPGLAIAAISLPWVAAATMQQGLFGGLQRFKDQAVIAALLLPLVIALPAVGARFGGFEGAAAGLAIAYFLRFGVGQIVLSRLFQRIGLKFRIGSVRKNMHLVLRMAVPATLSGILTSLAIWGGQTLLVRGPNGAEVLGMFAAAYTIKTMVMFIPGQSVIALLPVLSRSHVNPDADDPRRLLWTSAGLSAAVAVALAVPVFFLASPIMSVFGDDFLSAAPVLQLLLLSVPIETVTITIYQDIYSRGRYWTGMFAANVPLSASVLIAAALLVPDWQAQGLAIAWLIGWSLALVMTLGAVLYATPSRRH